MNHSPIPVVAALLSMMLFQTPCNGEVVNIDFGAANSVTYSGQGPFLDRVGNTLFDPTADFWNNVTPTSLGEPQAAGILMQSDGTTMTEVAIDFLDFPTDAVADRPGNPYAAADAQTLMQDFLIATSSYQAIFVQGLAPLTKYFLVLYGAADNPLVGTNFTIGGRESGTTTGTLGPDLDTPYLKAKEDYVMRTAIADETGRILIGFNTLGGEGAFNGLQIVGPFPAVTRQTLFTSELPDAPNVSDARSYELGTKFVTGKNGHLVAIRYWKSPSDAGLHTGRIWSTNGILLTSVEFTSESDSGWQTANLTPPLEISSGQAYIVSVNANTYFPVTLSGLENQVVNGDLSTVLGEGSLFGDMGAFPNSSYQHSNYFRDVVFVANP